MKRAKYTNDELQRAVDEVIAGASVATVSARTAIPQRTLRKWVHAKRQGVTRQPKRRGPAPVLTSAGDEAVYKWIIARQRGGVPVSRTDVIRKASEIAEIMTGKSVTGGWYQRFNARHDDLVMRQAQTLSRSRNAVQEEDGVTLFNTLLKVVIEYDMDASRIFNMDETAFQTRSKSKKVIAVRGSETVWCLDPSVSFHLSIVACGNAAGVAIPPLFVFPGKTVASDLLDDCGIHGAAVTTSESGFINASLFESWLRFFSASVPATVRRPLLLVLDGCSSHYSVSAAQVAEDLGILLVLLPANATHLLQPLDVSFFAPFKSKLRRIISEMVDEDETGAYTVDKVTAVTIVGLSWDRLKFRRYLQVGFATTGIFPLSLPNMQRRIRRYEANGVAARPREPWSTVKTVVEKEILHVPESRGKKPRKRKRVSVGGRLLTRELLEEAGKSSPQVPKKRRGKQSSHENVPVAVNITPIVSEAVV